MAALPFLSLLFIFLWFPHATRSTHICEKESCQWTGPQIQFPFRLRESNQSNRCSYPGFELLCNDRRQTLLTIPNAGDFLVKGISLQDQKVWINDPDLCLPRRFLHNINLTANSPFRFSDEYSLVNLIFLNCPSNYLTDVYTAAPITCLSPSKDGNYSVIAVLPDSIPFFSSCQFISSALFPSVDTPRWLFWNRIYADVALQWSTPDCKHCQGGHCGFSSDSGLDVACYGDEGQGLSRKAKYAIALGLGIPGLIGLIVLAYLVRGKVNLGGQQRPRQPIIELSGSNMPQPGLVAIGLDASTIEKYPITQLDESGGILLPNHNDNICSICLCEYQPKETLRTIPQCNHYFHVNCIDGWLKMNATCPLCRKLPERSSLPGATSSSSTNS